jgi:hypothetical protein
MLRGQSARISDLNGFTICFFYWKMCELSPWSRGPLLRSVHGGLETGIGRHAHRRMSRGCYGGRELTAGAPRERGGQGEPHRGRRGAARGRSEAGDDGPKHRWAGARCGANVGTER